MSGWDAYTPRDGLCDELVRQVPVPRATVDGIEVTKLELYSDGIHLVLTDHTPPPDGPERPFTGWVLRDDLGGAYQRRRGGVSRNLRLGPAHKHDVVFAHRTTLVVGERGRLRSLVG